MAWLFAWGETAGVQAPPWCAGRYDRCSSREHRAIPRPMAGPIRFDIQHRSEQTHARVGVVQTPHGSFQTPAFMPVGTRGTIKGLTPDQIRATDSEIILNNAYHLMLRPGDDLVARRGGVHRFMQWDGPILTDSGGYQAYSMSDINAFDDDGVTFKSIIDG